MSGCMQTPQLAASGRFGSGCGRVWRGLGKEKQLLFGSEDGREIPLATLGNWGAGIGNILVP